MNGHRDEYVGSLSLFVQDYRFCHPNIFHSFSGPSPLSFQFISHLSFLFVSFIHHLNIQTRRHDTIYHLFLVNSWLGGLDQSIEEWDLIRSWINSLSCLPEPSSSTALARRQDNCRLNCRSRMTILFGYIIWMYAVWLHGTTRIGLNDMEFKNNRDSRTAL